MANYKWPNVYPSIKDASDTLATNSVTTCAYVGEAEFGPINKPTFLSSLRDYTTKFGTLNSAKYNYAGYSLAVASESINSHYFVRIVKEGTADSHEPDDAKYAAVKIPAKGKTAGEASDGYYVEEIQNVEKTESAEGLFEGDEDNAMIVIANNPNNLKFSVSILDTTVNENKAYPFGSITYTQQTETNLYYLQVTTGADIGKYVKELDSENTPILTTKPSEISANCQFTTETAANAFITEKSLTNISPIAAPSKKWLATMTNTPTEVLSELAVNDDIEIVRVSAQNGVYTVLSISGTTLTFMYTAKSADTEDAPVSPLPGGKVSKYPEPNERTFQIDVKQKIGRTTPTVETFQYCTLYQAKDHFGSSTFVEDVVNASSEYIKVYVNPNLLAAAAANDTVIEIDSDKNNSYELTGGNAGGKPSTKDLLKGWDLFEDRNQVSVSLLLNSGYSNKEETSYQNKMLEIAEKRRDCFCLFDIPMSEVESENAIDWRKNIFGSNSYRGALSAPWVRTYDSVQGRGGFVMCPSAFVAKLIGQAGDPWNAPAGPNRGIISSSTVSPTGLTQAYDSVIGGTLYADNQINCLIRDTSAGYVNWGQRTLQQKPSALDRINVARTVIYIETILRDAARWHLFQNNTDYERMQIVLQFSQFLDTILSADGISSYKVICDESNNTPLVIQNNQLVIDVILQPVYSAESIILNTTVTSTDASVTVTSSAS